MSTRPASAPLAVLWVTVLAVTALALPRLAAAADPGPDPTFGTAGVLLLPDGLPPPPPGSPPVIDLAGAGFGGLGLTADDRVVVTDRGSVPAAATTPEPADQRLLVTRLLASGQPDPSHGLGGFASPASMEPWDLVLDPSGAAVVVGSERPFNKRALVVRVNPDGNLDPAFGAQGQTFIDVPGAGLADIGHMQADSIVRLGDGRYLVAGHWFLFAGTTEYFVVRLSAAGALDPSFGVGGFARLVQTGPVLFATSALTPDLVVLSDGRLVTPVYRNVPDPVSTTRPAFALWRLSAEGLPSPAGGDGVSVLPTVGTIRLGTQAVAVSALAGPRGTVYLGGGATVEPAVGDFARQVPTIVRVLADGRLDTSFGARGVVQPVTGKGRSATLVDLEAGPRGSVVGTGSLSNQAEGGPITQEALAVRVLSDGTPDRNFGGSGFVSFPVGSGSTTVPLEAAVDSAGRVVLSGYTSRADSTSGTPLNFVLRLRADPPAPTGVRLEVGRRQSVPDRNGRFGVVVRCRVGEVRCVASVQLRVDDVFPTDPRERARFGDLGRIRLVLRPVSATLRGGQARVLGFQLSPSQRARLNRHYFGRTPAEERARRRLALRLVLRARTTVAGQLEDQTVLLSLRRQRLPFP